VVNGTLVLTPGEIDALHHIAHRENVCELEVTDFRPDAPCLLVKWPGGSECLDDEGRSINPPVSELDGLPVSVFEQHRRASSR
jgi:hypothetical protein